MDNTGDILNSIVNDYENILSLAPEQFQEKIVKIRESLLVIVKQHLTDTDKILVELNKVTLQSSQTHMVISFLNHLISHFPHPVFVSSASQHNASAPDKKETQLNSCIDFLYHLATTLLRLLSSENISMIHEDVERLYIVLHELIKTKNITIYSRMITQLVNLNMELCTFSENYFDVNENVNSVETILLNSFNSDQHRTTDKSRNLVLTTFEQIEAMQAASTRLLNVLLCDVCQFVHLKVSKLISSVLKQIELGFLPLKSKSLDFMTKFIDFNSIDYETIDNFIPVLFSLIDIALNGLSSNQYTEAGFTAEEINKFSSSVENYFSKLFEVKHCQSAFGAKTQNALSQNITKMLLGHFSSSLVSIVPNNCLIGSTLKICKHLLVFVLESMVRDGGVSSVVLGQCNQIACWVARQDFSSLVAADAREMHLCLVYSLVLSFSTEKQQGMTDFTALFTSGCENMLKESQTITLQKNSKSGLLSVLQLSSQLLVAVEAFLHTFTIVSKVNNGEQVAKCCQDFGRHLQFSKIFINLFGEFVALGSQQKASENNLNPLLKIYNSLIHCANVVVLWLSGTSLQIQKEHTALLECSLMLFSLLWIEEHNWLDLKSPGNLKKTSVVSLSQALNSSGVTVNSTTTKQQTILSLCFTGISLLPSRISPFWRIFVLTKWGLNQTDTSITVAALQRLSFICTNVDAEKSSPYILPVTSALNTFLNSAKKVPLSEMIAEGLASLLTPFAQALSSNSLINSVFYANLQDHCLPCGIYMKAVIFAQPGNGILNENHLTLFNSVTKLLTIFSNKNDKSSSETVCKATISGICAVLEHSCKSNKPSSNVLSLLDQLFAFLRLQAKVADCSLAKIAAAENENWNLAVVECLQALFKFSIDKKELDLQSNIIKLAGSFLLHFNRTKSWADPLFSSSLVQICKLMCVESSQVSSTAYLEIETALKESAEQNFMKVQRSLICECAIQAILNPLQNSRSTLAILDDLSQLSDSSIEQFVSINLPFLIPPIFVTINSVASTTKNQLLSVLSQTIDKKTTDIIIQNFKHIFCYAVMKQSDLNGLFESLEKETRIKKESMILLNYGSLIQHLLAAVSTDIDRVCSALHFIHQIKSPDEKDVSISQLLNPHLLSVLTFFNGQFRLSNIPLSEKKQICSSIICLLKMMDRNDVTSACVKTINTLCLAQQVLIDSPEALVCCQAWDQLVRSVDPSTLGSILSQVVVMLLPFLDKHADQVAATMEFLVIGNSKHTRSNLGELYFVPEHEALAKVHAHVKRQLKRQQNEQNFLEKLEQTSKQITHENSVVREHALQRLREVLQQNQSALQRHHTTTSGSGDLMRHLVSMLFSSCRDSNPSVRLLAVKCLGEIGAVAPDRLSTAPEPKGESPSSSGGGTVARFSFDDPEFAYELIRSVAQAFLAAKPKHQDISAFAVQELLKVYDCSEAGRDSPGRRLWRRFSEQLQAVLEPHLSSRYMLKISDLNLSAMKRPILHRKQNMGFQEWIGTMCAVLMQMATSAADEASKVRRVAQACSAVVRNDINVALFLLPHLVLEVLRCDDQHTAFIIEEVMAVLESTDQMQDRKEHSNPPSASASATSTSGTSSQEDSKVTSLHGSPLSQLCAQAIFTVLDHVTRWLRQPAPTSGGTLAKTRHNRERQLAKAFLAKVPQKSLAMTSLRCRAHSRALMHYEAYLRESCDGRCDSEAASFLQRVFVEMDETDGVAGVVAVRGVEPTPETQLKLLESTGALQDAAACYEQIISSDPDDLLHHKGFVKCLIDLGQSATAISVISGFQSAHKEWEKDFLPLHSEACWRLGQWDQLESRLGPDPVARTTAEDWGTAVGRTLLAVKNRDWDKCRNLVDNLYLGQTEALSAASMESASYQRGYDSILRLHAVSDLERAIFDQSQGRNVDDVMSLWQLRFRLVQPSFRAKEPLLSLQRSLLGLLTDKDSPNLKRHLGKLWLQSSKLARKSSHLQTAFGALLSAQKFGLPEHCIEHAKWLWQKGESHQALLSLQRGVSEHFAAAAPTSGEQRKTRAKVMLLVAKLMEGSSSFDSNTVLKQYKEVVAYMGDWEDSHFHCAKYYDKLMTALLGENRGVGKAHHLYYIMHHYGLSLCYGNSHIYESLTKLLTVWFDYGANAAKLEKAGKPQSREDIQRVLDVIADLRKRLPAYVFFVAFSQLTSRICHQHGPTYVELKEILVKVIQAFPQRSLWSMLAISKSTFKQRAARCQEIFQRVSFKTLQVSKLINDATRLTNQLLELCNKPVTSVQPLSINQHFKGLKRTVEDPSFSQIMLPLQQFMAVTLPQKKGNSDPASQSQHDPFPEPVVHIVGFNDVVEVLPSLQRPKKVSMRASDGSSRLFLCKPKDDLRKDARLAEFAAIVNKCLKRDPESGRRELRIRTYAVVPLNEECGLIEWVNNMKGLRHILLPIYKARDLYTSGKQLKACQLPNSASLQKKLDVFRNKLLPRHPPVFHEWFLSSFPDASAWYNARLAYARSVAVMSMVGYILGLGDRHGENILFDANSGEAMHVDFNCLFNKGLTLEVPEIVPFRLTHNMVDAMGPTKYEGFFRRASEVTMNVLREQREPLMSVLKTFIHDPLVEWSKKSRSGGSSSLDENSGEVVNEKALSHMNDIDKRLRGIVAKSKGLPLSIEGHVHFLIQEATDQEKLCQMYIGWAPFM